MDKDLKELVELTDQLEESGIIKRDGSEYLYQLIIQRGKAKERASRSQTNNNNKESKNVSN